MPTVILLDTSLSMIRPVPSGDNCESSTILQLAIHGINYFLDYLATNEKLEFVSLVTFSSSFEVLSNFTRDFDQIKAKLAKVEEQDKTCLEIGLSGVRNLVLAEWGTSVPCNVVLFTDGNVSNVNLRSPMFHSPLPFPGKLYVVCLTSQQNPTVPVFHRLVEMAGTPGGTVFAAEPGPITLKTVHSIIQKLADTAYSSYMGLLKCGNLSARIGLHPAPQPFTKSSPVGIVSKTISDVIDVFGFIDSADIGNLMAVSRHLVVPLPVGKIKEETENDEETDEGKIPSFCVLFHGALKVENVVALCTVGEEWFGVLYSWADSKKKSNLMLTIFEPGNEAVPWLGDLNYVAALDEYPQLSSQAEHLCFPVRPAEKRSYSQNTVVWIKRAGLQSDIQKILRHARKLPEKTQQFYKELNRLRRAAVSFGFVELLDGLAVILERECMLLPSGVHPDCALQLNNAAAMLRNQYSRDLKYPIVPLKTKFHNDNE